MVLRLTKLTKAEAKCNDRLNRGQLLRHVIQTTKVVNLEVVLIHVFKENLQPFSTLIYMFVSCQQNFLETKLLVNNLLRALQPVKCLLNINRHNVYVWSAFMENIQNKQKTDPENVTNRDLLFSIIKTWKVRVQLDLQQKISHSNGNCERHAKTQDVVR